MFTADILHAHPGATDTNNGHYEQQTGKYHLHGSGESRQTTVRSQDGITNRTTTRKTSSWVAGEGVLNVGQYRRKIIVIETFKGQVIGLSDGDTLEIMHGRNIERINLYGIDTPESNNLFGQKVLTFTEEMVTGKNVTIELMATNLAGQKAGLIEINGINLNRKLVQKGYAWVTDDCTADYCNEWQELQENARKNKDGLWAIPDHQAPWKQGQ